MMEIELGSTINDDVKKTNQIPKNVAASNKDKIGNGLLKQKTLNEAEIVVINEQGMLFLSRLKL